MKTVVFAYQNMGLAGLVALRRAGYEIASVFSHEDDPNENCWFGSVKEWAERQGITVHCPKDIRDPQWAAIVAELRPDMIFSFYYRYMLGAEMLDIPPLGAYNLHGSLLPAYRGRCPVNWVLVRGETQTGVTLHHMVSKADAGDIVGQRAVTIDRTDTAVTLNGKLCEAASLLLGELLPLMKEGKAPRITQNIERGSYFGGRKPEDGRIDWGWDAGRIYNLIRAVTDPYPGAFCGLPDGSRLLIWWAMPEEGEATGVLLPGTVEVEGGRVLARTGYGRLRLLDVEREKVRMTGERLLQYFINREGMVLS